MGSLAAGIVGLLVAFPSFRTRGDYLAIVTLALNMIVKSAIENLEVIGGPRGFLGMQRLTTLPWVDFWVISSLGSSATSSTPTWAGACWPSGRMRWPRSSWGWTPAG